MSWTDSGINWETPVSNTPIWTVCVELAQAINERYRLSNHRPSSFTGHPLIAITEADNWAGSSGSIGRRQYKMYQTADKPYLPNSMNSNNPLWSIKQALESDFMYIFGRTDLLDYTVDELNPRTIKELSVHGFPQTWRNANDTGMSDIEWVESLYPASNDIISRIISADASLFTDHGYLKKEIFGEIFELMKAFKFMYFHNQGFIGQEVRREVFNQPLGTFNATWAATADTVNSYFGDTLMYTTTIDGTGNVSAVVRNSEQHNLLGDAGFTYVPDFVTTPRVKMVVPGGYEGAPTESIGEGFFDLGTRVESVTTSVIEYYVTPGGTTPGSLTFPSDPDDYYLQKGTVTTGSGGSVSHMCYDLTTYTDMDYPVDGS